MFRILQQCFQSKTITSLIFRRPLFNVVEDNSVEDKLKREHRFHTSQIKLLQFTYFYNKKLECLLQSGHIFM